MGMGARSAVLCQSSLYLFGNNDHTEILMFQNIENVEIKQS